MFVSPALATVFANLVSAGMARAYTAAETVQAAHPDVDIEVWIRHAESIEWEEPDVTELPSVSFLVEFNDEPQGSGEVAWLSLNNTGTAMRRMLEATVARMTSDRSDDAPVSAERSEAARGIQRVKA